MVQPNNNEYSKGYSDGLREAQSIIQNSLDIFEDEKSKKNAYDLIAAIQKLRSDNSVSGVYQIK